MAAKQTARTAPFVSEKAARLRQVTGRHLGPWTSAEYEAAFGPPLGPNRDPRPEPPAEVAELAEQRDLALAAFERVHEQWIDAIRAERRAQDAGPVRVDRTGQLITDASLPRKLIRARAAAAEIAERRDDASHHLTRATNRWRAAEKAWRNRLAADEYHATKQR